jgi:hypothetical protein
MPTLQPTHELTPEVYRKLSVRLNSRANLPGARCCRDTRWRVGYCESHHSTDSAFLLNLQVRSRDCFVYNSDMRVRVSQTGLYTYPDVASSLRERNPDRRDTR